MHWRLVLKAKMSSFFKIIVLLCFWNCFSQSVFENMPENAKEIHFTYEKKSKYIIADNGVYGDSIALAIDFPLVKTILKKHPKFPNQQIHFASFKDMNKEEERFLASSIYHTNEIIKGTYFVPSKTTVFYVTRDDEETKLAFKKYFSERYYKFEYRQEFNYNTRMEKRKYPGINYKLKFDEIEKTIFFEDAIYGSYKEIVKGIQYTNIVLMNPNLSKYISPYIFTNNTNGVEKIDTINQTITLLSVSYK
jgi:hypothetical protein